MPKKYLIEVADCQSIAWLENDVAVLNITEIPNQAEGGLMEEKLKEIRKLNNALYEALPSGNIDAFELIKLIGSHYEKVEKVLGDK